MASQRVRPEVAGPMTGSATPERASLRGLRKRHTGPLPTLPRKRGRTSVPVPARGFACGPPDLSHMKREAGAKRTARGGWPRCLPSLFPFRRRHCERQRSNPVSISSSLDRFVSSFLAMTKRIWNAGRRRADLRTLGCGAVPRGTARLPAFHHGSSQEVCGPLVRSGPGFVGKPSKGRGSLRRRPTHFQRRTSHAGRNAGRHDARTARERVANPPAGSASRPTAAVCLRGGVLTGRDDLHNM